ncbi:response regulator [Geobacter sp. DSM 9736]|uniref:response regulator n=1 Tax=Geobacter sp. DSM 9736 TaxID=1277350 RepID=UPI000B509F07|nr:response regulator [Geobacter sp. DSM 9736]SNB44776.1 Response regulator receiver domain-containing protein [Geobacter sp. DSM 9736]
MNEGACSILLVDDNGNDRELLRRFFTAAGFEAACAPGGEEALRLLEERQPDVLITDLNMPEIDGLQLSLMARSILPDISVVLITADVTPELAPLARRAGICAIFSKPLDLRRLHALVKEEKRKRDLARTGKSGTPSAAWGCWTCPVCGTPHQGWSPINICAKCGFKD